MSESHKIRFSDLVERQLAPQEEARALWIPIAQEFDRDGPDAAREYLSAEGQQLEGRIKELLQQVEEG